MVIDLPRVGVTLAGGPVPAQATKRHRKGEIVMVEANECPGTHLIFTQNEHDQLQLLCGETGGVLRTFKNQNDAIEYGIFLVSEHGPWNVEFKKKD